MIGHVDHMSDTTALIIGELKNVFRRLHWLSNYVETIVPPSWTPGSWYECGRPSLEQLITLGQFLVHPICVSVSVCVLACVRGSIWVGSLIWSSMF